jgi:hypothetical protein
LSVALKDGKIQPENRESPHEDNQRFCLQEAFLAASAAIIDDIKTEYERCKSSGVIDGYSDFHVELI